MLEVDSEKDTSKAAVRTMLKFLTQKLRSHSINEDPNEKKTDNDRDSGTESDDEFQNSTNINQSTSPMKTPSTTESTSPFERDINAPMFTLIRARSEEPLKDSNIETVETSLMTVNSTICQSRQTKLISLNLRNDQHSSEEELEVINSPKVVTSQNSRSIVIPEKRKWSQVNGENGSQCHRIHTHQSSSSVLLLLSQQKQQQGQRQEEKNQQENKATEKTQRINGSVGIVVSYSAPVSRAEREAPGSSSSDEEIQGLLSCNDTNTRIHTRPVQFHTSPPMNAHKPGRSLSPPPKLFHASIHDSRPRSRPRYQSHLYHHHHHQYHHHHHHHHHHYHHHHHHHHRIDSDVDSLSRCSPRKRHRPPHRQPRPCLDFEKMQQLKVRALTTWRHSDEHGSELSVFCW